MRDVIVIGAGLSGLMGALILAEAGRRPLVLAKGQGTTHWTAGTIDILGIGATNGASGDQSLRETLRNFIAEHPEHPYARVEPGSIEDAIDRFRNLMEAARYPYAGSLERNVLLPTALGALRPAALMPATMAAGDIRLDGDMVIAGFTELRDFFPPLIAANLVAQGVNARGVYLQVPATGKRLDYTPRTFANLFDNADFRREIGTQLRGVRGTARRIGLPAVLGLRDPLGVVQDLQEMSGAQIFEIPTLPPSVPGMRLFRIFRDAITQAGGRLQIGSEVLHSMGSENKLLAISTEAAAREQQHQAKAFLLATGGIAGGGIRTDYQGAAWDTAMNLPLRLPNSREEWFASRFLHHAGHPIFQAGIPTDASLRPVDEQNTVVYQNVVVAGSALASSDTIQERCTTGLALATGWRAGHILVDMLQTAG